MRWAGLGMRQVRTMRNCILSSIGKSCICIGGFLDLLDWLVVQHGLGWKEARTCIILDRNECCSAILYLCVVTTGAFCAGHRRLATI